MKRIAVRIFVLVSLLMVAFPQLQAAHSSDGGVDVEEIVLKKNFAICLSKKGHK